MTLPSATLDAIETAARLAQQRSRNPDDMLDCIMLCGADVLALVAMVRELQAEVVDRERDLAAAAIEKRGAVTKTKANCRTALDTAIARATSAEAERDSLREENERLRKALEPFAEWLPCNHADFDGQNTFEIEPELNALRNAARALATESGDG